MGTSTKSRKMPRQASAYTKHGEACRHDQMPDNTGRLTPPDADSDRAKRREHPVKTHPNGRK